MSKKCDVNSTVHSLIFVPDSLYSGSASPDASGLIWVGTEVDIQRWNSENFTKLDKLNGSESGAYSMCSLWGNEQTYKGTNTNTFYNFFLRDIISYLQTFKNMKF